MQCVAPICSQKWFLRSIKNVSSIGTWMADWYVRLLDLEWGTDFSEICIPEIDFFVDYRGHMAYTVCCTKSTVSFPAGCEEKTWITPTSHDNRSLFHKRKEEGSRSRLTLEIRTGWHSYNFLWGSCQEHELDIRSVSDMLISRNKHISQNTRAEQLCSG